MPEPGCLGGSQAAVPFLTVQRASRFITFTPSLSLSLFSFFRFPIPFFFSLFWADRTDSGVRRIGGFGFCVARTWALTRGEVTGGLRWLYG